MQVLKFGGSSMGSAESIANVLSIVKQKAEKGPLAVVVSAMNGVTDLLVETCDSTDSSSFNYEEVIERLEKSHRPKKHH